jgi:hypothetical protein
MERDKGAAALPELSVVAAPSLVRRPSVTGNVLVLTHPTRGTRAYLLQRKTASTAYGGSVRVGFLLQGSQAGTADGLWSLAAASSSKTAGGDSPEQLASAIPTDTRGRYEMVTVFMENEVHLAAPAGQGPRGHNLRTELAALQWIANEGRTTSVDHLWGSEFMGKDSGLLCTVLTPWHTDGTLQDYCATQKDGILPLDEGRFFFRQILKVRR